MTDVQPLAQRIRDKSASIPSGESMLVAVSGIDGSGKGYLTALLVAELERLGARAANLNVDGWLNLPAKRFDASHPAEHFYEYAIRFQEMFEQLVLPLKRRRSVRVEVNYEAETAQSFRRRTYEFHDIDVIVLEGVYLLKRAFLHHYDFKVWVDCSFETALERALQRGQEGLPPEDTVRAYQTIYFPAQEIHFEHDDPRASADAVWVNDARLGEEGLKIPPLTRTAHPGP